MAYAVIELNQVAATDVAIYNRTATSGSKLEQASLIRLDTLSSGSGQGEVFAATQIATGSLVDVWMVNGQVIPFLASADGELFNQGSEDPRNFYNPANRVFDAFKPVPGDIVTLSEDCFTGAKSTNTHANATTGTWQLVWGAVHAPDALCFKYLATKWISIGNPAVASGRVTAYRMQCLAN